MFDQEKVCKRLLNLLIEKGPEIRADLLGEILREIRNRPIVKQGYSPEEIKGFVDLVVEEARTMSDKERIDYIKGQVADLNGKFQRSLGDWDFIIPVENLKLGVRSLKVGDVVFSEFTSWKRKKILTKLSNWIKDNPKYSSEHKERFIKDFDEDISSLMQNRICAFVRVEGKLEKAQLDAYDKVEAAIAALKLYKPSNYDSRMQYFHITGKIVQQTKRPMLGYSGRNITFQIETVGFLFPFEIDDKRIRTMRENGFSKLSKMLRKEKPNDLEGRIINSVRLFASACDVVVTKSRESVPFALGFVPREQSKPETTFEAISMNDRLIKLFVALESLLIFDEGERLASNIAERVAFLLGRNYEQRAKIKRFLKRMYRLRSAHVHHGKSDITHPVLEKFTTYVQTAVLRLIINKDRIKLSTEEDLQNWFERKKLS